jgi:hypothetical protein
MRLPVIKSLTEFIENNDEDYVLEAIEVLEHVGMAKGIKDEEINVIAELISNMYGSIEVSKQVKKGVKKSEALNGFMKRVMGSIDK